MQSVDIRFGEKSPPARKAKVAQRLDLQAMQRNHVGKSAYSADI
jgi:hypothetical protein